MDKIILIGGSPTAGKSHTARILAEALKLPWISTDAIREQMRQIVRKEDYPALFELADDSIEKAVKMLNTKTAEDIVENQNKESEDVWKGVKALIDTDYVWGSFIIEGVAILPKLVAELVKEDKDIKAVFLVDEDEERVRETVFTRGLMDAAEKYPDEVKEGEVQWVMAFNKYIKQEAEKYSLPVVSIGDREKYIEEVKKIINSSR